MGAVLRTRLPNRTDKKGLLCIIFLIRTMYALFYLSGQRY